MKVNRALKTSQPAVNALLQAKMDEAESQDIDFFLEVASQLSELAIEPWELCKVLGNLIDNAVAAVEKLPGEKRISLEIRETKEAYLFDVRNNGPIIQKEYRKLIFHQGFTTKGGTDHGMGLSIVSAIVKEARGSITYESTEEETCFRVTIPKKERKEGWQWKL
jgi:sensor histidine kinase regulating citrate/malate metabolism